MASTDEARPIRALSKDVVNRIAAGEVIHRPASALKEMLENSLDAGSTSINVLSRAGGMKLLQISDNGHGIALGDFPRVCERFATSKLREYEDLEQIETFGFRGEALASISHVAHVSITSMTAGAPCAYRATYADGVIVPAKSGEAAEPKACAGTQGTQIVVEDMFFNIPMRRAAIKGAGEEYSKILQVVQAYAIDNAGVAMSCKKAGETATELHTLTSHSTLDVIRLVYGAAVARELIPVEADDPSLGLRIRGYVCNANFSQKRLTFQLFINKRLVESTHLRRAIEEVYASYLPKHTHPFVYVSLRLPPNALDVNVHPTKREVHFLHQEEVVGAVQSALRDVLLGSNTSRTYFTQAVLPGEEARGRSGLGGSAGGGRGGAAPRAGEGAARPAAAAAAASSGGGKSAPDPRKLVRANEGMKIGELDKYICRPSDAATRGSVAPPREGETAGGEGGAAGGLRTGDEAGGAGKRLREGAASIGETSDAGGAPELTVGVPASTCGGKRQMGEAMVASDRPWVACELSSIHRLLRVVTQNAHRGLAVLFRQHIYVGAVDASYVLLQHQTKLYVVHIGAVSEEFFYQQTLHRWGNLALLTLSSPAPIVDLCVLALRDPRAEWRPADGAPADIGAAVARLLTDKAEMLEEYVSLVIQDGAIVALPQLVDGYVPPLNALPLFTLRLASHVQWDAEEPCFDSLARLLASLFRVDQIGELDEQQQPAAAAAGPEALAETGCSPAWTIQHLLLPSIRRTYEPPAEQASDHTVVQVACTEQLYKIFERC